MVHVVGRDGCRHVCLVATYIGVSARRIHLELIIPMLAFCPSATVFIHGGEAVPREVPAVASRTTIHPGQSVNSTTTTEIFKVGGLGVTVSVHLSRIISVTYREPPGSCEALFHKA